MNLLEALRYLLALQQHRRFGRAAQACRITQPALSDTIRALESHFKVAIVRRSRQYEGLTPEGAVVLAHAHRLLHEAEALHQALASRADVPQGRLQLGAVPGAMPVAARFAARLQTLHPVLLPVLRSLSSSAIDAGVDNLSLDLALGYSSRPEVPARKLAVAGARDRNRFGAGAAGGAAAARPGRRAAGGAGRYRPAHTGIAGPAAVQPGGVYADGVFEPRHCATHAGTAGRAGQRRGSIQGVNRPV